MTVDMPVCYLCKHKEEGSFTCPAFPKGIPEKIILEGDPHQKPIKGQKNEIVFEAKDAASAKTYREILKEKGL